MKKGRRASLTVSSHLEELPNNFQEVVILSELDLKKKLSIDSIRKLSFLYSLAIEHYDSANQSDLMSYYADKMNMMLTQGTVMELLDKRHEDGSFMYTINETDNDLLYKELFGSKKKKTPEHSMTTVNFERIDTLSSCPLSTDASIFKSITKLSSKEKNHINELVQDEIKMSNKTAERITECLSSDIINQKVIFEERKQQKKKIMLKKRMTIMRQSICDLNKNEVVEKVNEATISHPFNKCYSGLRVSELPKERMSNPFTRKNSCGNSIMMTEIENYISKNMKEMYIALDELKESFNTEIVSYNKNGLPDMALCYEEERDEALESLKYQYELQREKETQQIKNKYRSLKSSVM